MPPNEGPGNEDIGAKLAIVAGGGPMPLEIVDACRAQGRPYFVVVLDGQASVEDYGDHPHLVTRLGAAGSALKRLKDEGCGELVMAGAVTRPSLAQLRPDVRTARFFMRSGAMAFGDDGLLTAIIKTLEHEEGLTVRGVDEVLPDIVAAPGPYGSHQPDENAKRDVAVAVDAALDIGRRDVGQGAVARDGSVLATEGADGTDAMLANLPSAADGAGLSGAVAKVSKPGQDRRADLPTIGLSTVEAAHRAGLAGIAVEAGGALVMQRQQMIARADALGLFVIGIEVPKEASP